MAPVSQPTFFADDSWNMIFQSFAIGSLALIVTGLDPGVVAITATQIALNILGQTILPRYSKTLSKCLMTTGTWALTYFGAQCFAPTLKSFCALNITSGHTNYIGGATLFLIIESFLLALIPQESLRANPKRQKEKDLAVMGVVLCPHRRAYAQS